MSDSCPFRPDPQNVSMPPQNVTMPPQNVTTDNDNTNDTDSNSAVECSLCYKSFANRWNLDRHVLVCKGLGHPHMCSKCNRVFSNRHSKSRHMKTCDGTGNEQAIVLHDGASSSGTVATTTAPTTQSAPAVTANLNQCENVTLNQQNNQNTINVIINSFGKEDLSHLTPEMLDERLHELNGAGLFNVIKAVHFNPDKPENQNIRLDSKKSKTLKVKEDDGWHIRANCDIIEVLMAKYKSILVRRSHEPDFKDKLKHESDFMQIQQDLIKFNRQSNCTAYYRCAHKLIALIQDLECHEEEI